MLNVLVNFLRVNFLFSFAIFFHEYFLILCIFILHFLCLVFIFDLVWVFRFWFLYILFF